MPIDKRMFRDALGRFATGVTVITTASAGGHPSGFTASSFCSVSLDPPLVLFCLDRGADSLDDFVTADHFAINILRHDHEHLSRRFAARGSDKWHGMVYDTWDGGCPILPDALVALECRKEQIHDGGDHLIIVGRVMRLAVDDSGGEPLIHHLGDYRRLS